LKVNDTQQKPVYPKCKYICRFEAKKEKKPTKTRQLTSFRVFVFIVFVYSQMKCKILPSVAPVLVTKSINSKGAMNPPVV